MNKGKISIYTENLLPIIKKWLYSDTDIFVRELVANGCDAVSKLRAISSMEEEGRVDVVIDKEKGTITISDNGIGMTSEEIDKYINQVAFSGAQEFLDKLETAGADAQNIIGHFGLGFYSAFMVADKVVINSLSYQEGARSAMWQSDGGLEYELGEGSRKERGTDIILHITQEQNEYLEDGKVLGICQKYLSFMPVPIFVNGAEEPINDPAPLYMKRASEISDDEYKEFYKKTFGAWEDPLFWVHLNIDFPFTLHGILYFPRIRKDYRIDEGSVRLYCRQVFVAENIKEIIPDYLLLLKGVIDSPDIPLNVSRSFLQSDSQVKKLSAHISRKVADRLVSLHKDEMERYQSLWDDVNIFIKYGCLRDEKFYDRVKKCLIFKTTDSQVLSLDDVLTRCEDGKSVYYVGEENKGTALAELYEGRGISMLLMDGSLDTQFISYLEYKEPKLKFARIDSQLSEENEKVDDETTRLALEELMREAAQDDRLTVRYEAMREDDPPAVLIYDEQARRFKEASAMWGEDFAMPIPATLVVNANHALVAALLSKEGEEKQSFSTHLFDLAQLAQGNLSKERIAAFIARSYGYMK